MDASCLPFTLEETYMEEGAPSYNQDEARTFAIRIASIKYDETLMVHGGMGALYNDRRIKQRIKKKGTVHPVDVLMNGLEAQ